jgi:PhnB protein
MARVTTYLNFEGTAEEAFAFYADVFGTSVGPIVRMGEMPSGQGPELSDAEKELVMHATVEILAGHVLMATDMLGSMGHSLVVGNNTTINLEPDSREEAERLYAALSEGSSDCFALQDMPWGLWGTCLDRYNVRWMFNVANEAGAAG